MSWPGCEVEEGVALKLHALVVAASGGREGLRDGEELRAALSRPLSGVFGRRLFATPYEQAGALMETVIQRHPFVDGNKRVGLLLAGAWLHMRGIEIEASDEELVEVTMGLTEGRIGREEVTQFLVERGVEAQPKSEVALI